MIEAKEIANSVYERRNECFDEACRRFFNWKDSVNETSAEYESRIKKAKILRITKNIFENELSEKERKILSLKYAGNKSFEEIATEFSTNRSVICRIVRKTEHTIKEKLKYVLEYAEMDLRNEVAPVSVSEAIGVMAACALEPDRLGERLKKTRNMKCLTPEKVAAATKMSPERYCNIEAGGKVSVQELVRLALFFSVSADYLIFGV